VNTDWDRLGFDLWYLCLGLGAGAYFGFPAFVGFPVSLVLVRILMSEFRMTRSPTPRVETTQLFCSCQKHNPLSCPCGALWYQDSKADASKSDRSQS
jgi:hypothetical protein